MKLAELKEPKDIWGKTAETLAPLAEEMRTAILKKAQAVGGHVGSNLGIIEPTLALHATLRAPFDKLIFDVSHDCYAHKMICGRARAWTDPAHYQNCSGFTSPQEEPDYDLFSIGHTSTSISLAGGMMVARSALGEKYHIACVIGDGALSGGMSFEGLDHVAELGGQLLIVVNDNDMSISENHGGIYTHLRKLREHNGKLGSPNYFETLGLHYSYVEEGNDIDVLIAAFSRALSDSVPHVVHIHTQKGLGFEPAQTHVEEWHYSAPFLEGATLPTNKHKGGYSDIAADHLIYKMKKDPLLHVVTAGVAGGLGFNKYLREQAGSQFIDVGIAEAHATALCVGIERAGGKAIFGTSATFMQRAFDQFLHDGALNQSRMVVLLYSGSAWGGTDVTHLGTFIGPALSTIPNVTYLNPTNIEELLEMLDWAIDEKSAPGPVVIAMPSRKPEHARYDVVPGFDYVMPAQICEEGERVMLFGLGDAFELCVEARKLLDARGISCALVNARSANVLDEELMVSLESGDYVVGVVEASSYEGGLAQKVAARLAPFGVRVLSFAIPTAFYDRFKIDDLLLEAGMRPEDIAEQIAAVLGA